MKTKSLLTNQSLGLILKTSKYTKYTQNFNMKIKTKQEIFVRRFDASSIIFTVNL